MRVRAPASSANLGAGFDALGLAVDLPIEAVIDGDDPVEDGHPAQRAFAAHGGTGTLSVSTRIPPGKGLGFSGASYVVGVAAALAQREGTPDRAEVLSRAAALDGHADNVAASTYGGLTVTTGARTVAVPVPDELAVIVWIPDASTSTRRSRTRLRRQVPLADAAHNIGRAALMVAAVATGDLDALADATDDRLHQQARLADSPESAAALRAADEAGALACWLSGSGPTIAAFARSATADAIAASLPPGGHTKVLAVDHQGLRVDRSYLTP